MSLWNKLKKRTDNGKENKFMKSFYTFVVKKKIAVLIIFAILFLVSFVAKNLVSVNYEINDYLPKNSHSTASIDVLKEEFGGGIPNARVMIKDVTIPEALEYKQKLGAVDGVIEITWLDDSVDITTPIEMLDKKTVEAHYKDGAALFSLTVKDEAAIEAVAAIEEIIGPENSISGNAVSLAAAPTKTMTEVPIITAITVVFALLLLVLTTTSFAEPILVLIGLGMAIILNAGSNLIFGEISFITNASGNILLLGVSLDYSVFLIHRFVECRKTQADPEAAMIEALTKSTSSILSSGLTTVIGFLALALMKFRIGPDLGLALAKGIALSLVTVFLFMPCLILVCYKLIDKTEHKPFLPSFKKFGKLVVKITPVFVVILAVVAVPAYLASSSNSFYYGASRIFGTETKIGADALAIEEAFGENNIYVLMVPKGDTPTEKALSDELHTLPNVTSILSYVDTVGSEIPPSYLDKNTLSLLQGENYTRFVITVNVPIEGEESFAVVEEVREIAEKHYPDEYYLAGSGISTYDLMDAIQSDMLAVNLIAIGAVLLILIISMKAIVAPILLVLSIEAAIWINLAVPYFSGDVIFYIAYLIISAIQLGATVDYAILLTDRYRENRETLPKKEAMVTTISDVTVSVLTSGLVMTVVGFLMGIISSNKLLAQLGIFIGRGAIFSLAIVLFALPGMLMLFDKFIIKKKKDSSDMNISETQEVIQNEL